MTVRLRFLGLRTLAVSQFTEISMSGNQIIAKTFCHVAGAETFLPALVTGAGSKAVKRFLEFFNIRNEITQMAPVPCNRGHPR